MSDDKAALKQQAMYRSMVQTNHHRSQTIPGNLHEQQLMEDRLALRQAADQLEKVSMLEKIGAVSRDDLRKVLKEHGLLPTSVPPQPLSQTDATAIVTEGGEKRQAAGYPFKDEVVVSLEHYEKTVAELAAARYEVTKLKQKVNDLTNALSNARDAAATIARDKGHLERRIGELVVEAEHYKARMKR